MKIPNIYNVLLTCMVIPNMIICDYCDKCNSTNYFRGKEMNGGFFVHTIQQQECKELCDINSIEYGDKNVSCTSEDEGVRLIYLRDDNLYMPTEVLVMCKQFENLAEKISEFRKFIKKFSNFHVHKKLNDSEMYCRERSGVEIEPLYTTQVCEFEQLVHYKRGEMIESIISDFHDITQLTNFYNKLNKELPKDFKIEENSTIISNIGCDKDNVSESENGRCKLETNIKKVANDSVEMIDRIHCCCNGSSNCDKMRRNTKAKMFCPTSSMNYFFNETGVKLMDATKDSVPIQELNMKTLCFTRVIFVKDVSKNDSIFGTMRVVQNNDGRPASGLALDLSIRTGCNVIYEMHIEQISSETQLLCWENMEIQSSNNTSPNVSHEKTDAPRIHFNGTLFNLLFEVTSTEWKLRKEMWKVLHRCAFLYQPPDAFFSEYCYFYYDPIRNKILNIRSGNNFLFLDNEDQTFLIQNLLKENREGICINMGGCQKGTPCDNIDRPVFLCYCSNGQNYCDLKLFRDVDSDRNRTKVEYFKPYCNTGNFTHENGNIEVPKNPTGSLNQFFCYEKTTVISKEVNFVTTGFFNRIAHRHYIESESKCLTFTRKHSKEQCTQDGNTFFCCCKAYLRSSREHVDSRGACNKGDDVLHAYQRSLLFNITILSNTMKERTHCDGISGNIHLRTQISTQDMAFMPQLKCYFSIPLRPLKLDIAEINMYYYDPYNPKEDNRGIFSMLCNHRKWSKAELIDGYACRVMSTSMFKGGQDELACCSVAHLSEKSKETIYKQINKFILPNNFTRKDDRR